MNSLFVKNVFHHSCSYCIQNLLHTVEEHSLSVSRQAETTDPRTDAKPYDITKPFSMTEE